MVPKPPQGKNRTRKILELLKRHYPHARIILRYSNSWELLVATILSAQCTDKRVNSITEYLFKKYPRIEDYAHAPLHQFENDIRSAGFFRAKAKNIISAAHIICEHFNGKVPGSMDALCSLPGVARKTANVVLYNAFHRLDGIAVDTHVRRLSQRLGLSHHEDPEKIEQDLMCSIPKPLWGHSTYWLIEHGRTICAAKKPQCTECFLKLLCPFGKHAGRSGQQKNR